MSSLAARFPGWIGYLHLADGYLAHARGCFGEAQEAFERGLAVSEPDSGNAGRSTGAWLRLEAAYVELLIQLERLEQARERAARALERSEAEGIGLSAFVVRRALALAEGRLGGEGKSQGSKRNRASKHPNYPGKATQEVPPA